MTAGNTIREKLQARGVALPQHAALPNVLWRLVRNGHLHAPVVHDFLKAYYDQRYGGSDGQESPPATQALIEALDAAPDAAFVDLVPLTDEELRDDPRPDDAPPQVDANLEGEPDAPMAPEPASAPVVPLASGNPGVAIRGLALLAVAIVGFLAGKASPTQSPPAMQTLPDPGFMFGMNQPLNETSSASWFREWISLEHDGGEGRGLSWVDVDNDGDLDLFQASTKGPRLWTFQGGRSTGGQFPGVDGPVRAGVWGDVDSDGDLDLLTANMLAPPGLFLTNQTELERASWELEGHHNAEGAAILDGNGDGALDLLVPNGEHGNVLFVAPTWEPQPFDLGTPGNGDFLLVADFNRDGRSDVLYNHGGGMLALSKAKGFHPAQSLQIGVGNHPNDKRGLDVADIDHDGWLDLVVAHPTSGIEVYAFEDNGFVLREDTGDLRFSTGGTSALFGDFNADGEVDLIVGGDTLQMFEGTGRGAFHYKEPSRSVSIRAAKGVRGLAAADVDGDGDLDLAVNADSGGAGVFLGVPEAPRYLSRLTVLADGHPPGTEIVAKADGIRRTEWAGKVYGMGSQTAYRATFCLPPGPVTVLVGDQEQVVELKSGHQTVTIQPSGS